MIRGISSKPEMIRELADKYDDVISPIATLRSLELDKHDVVTDLGGPPGCYESMTDNNNNN